MSCSVTGFRAVEAAAWFHRRVLLARWRVTERDTSMFPLPGISGEGEGRGTGSHGRPNSSARKGDQTSLSAFLDFLLALKPSYLLLRQPTSSPSSFVLIWRLFSGYRAAHFAPGSPILAPLRQLPTSGAFQSLSIPHLCPKPMGRIC